MCQVQRDVRASHETPSRATGNRLTMAECSHDEVRLCVVGDGAPWIWNQIQDRFPQARQVLDYSHCSARIHRVATAIYGEGLKGQEWAEATLRRLDHGEVGQVIGGLKRMGRRSAQADHEIIKLIDYVHEHRYRTTYERLRRGGYPL